MIVGAEYSGKSSILKSLVGEESYERFFSHNINERKLKHSIYQKEYDLILRDIPSKNISI